MTSFRTLPAKRQTILALLALVFMAVCLYGNTLDNDFVLDDTFYIRDNYLLHNLSNVPRFFNVPSDSVVEDLPSGFLKGRNIRWVTFAVDYALGGGSPVMFHLSNILWHFLAAGALFFLFRRWLADAAFAFFGAAIFLAQPIQTAAVAYIFGRKDVLAAFFLFLTFLSVYRFRGAGKKRWLPVIALCFFLAYFSKEVAAVFPLLLVAADLCFGPRRGLLQDVRENLRRHWLEYGFSFFLAGLFVWHTHGLRLVSQLFAKLSSSSAAGAVVSAAINSSAAPEGNLSFANLMAFYLWKLIFPANLLADYRGVFDFSLYPVTWGSLISPIFLVLFVLLMIWLRRQWPAGAFGIGWIVITLLPVSHIVDFHYPVAEHYLYLPCAGFALFVSSSFYEIQKKVGNTAIVLLGILLLVYSTATFVRNRAWQNMETITLDILKKAPSHLRARSTLVHLLAEQGKIKEAISQGEFISNVYPNSAINHYNLGTLYEDTGDYEKAIYHYKMAITLKKTLWDAYLNLGNLLLQTGREKEGREVIGRLLQLYGYDPMAFWVLGNDQARKGNWEQARSFYLRMISLDPQEGAGYLGMMGVYWNEGKKEEGRQMLSMALDKGLDLGWAREQEPWTSFFERPDVADLLKKSNGKRSAEND